MALYVQSKLESDATRHLQAVIWGPKSSSRNISEQADDDNGQQNDDDDDVMKWPQW